MKNEHKQCLEEIKKITERNDGFYVSFEVDEFGQAQFFDFGSQTEVITDILPYMFTLNLLIVYFLKIKSIPKNRTYRMHFSIIDGKFTQEIFGIK